MAVRICGAHQGAGATSAWCEASGDLQLANEERDADADKGRGTMARGEGEDEAMVSWWLYDDITCPRRAQCEGQSAVEDSRCGSPDRIPSSTLAPPLQYHDHGFTKTIIVQLEFTDTSKSPS